MISAYVAVWDGSAREHAASQSLLWLVCTVSVLLLLSGQGWRCRCCRVQALVRPGVK